MSENVVVRDLGVTSTTLDLAIESLVEIVLLDLIEDRLEYSIGDLDTSSPSTDREVAIVLSLLVKDYSRYDGPIYTYLEDLGYSYRVEVYPNPIRPEVYDGPELDEIEPNLFNL